MPLYCLAQTQLAPISTFPSNYQAQFCILNNLTTIPALLAHTRLSWDGTRASWFQHPETFASPFISLYPGERKPSASAFCQSVNCKAVSLGRFFFLIVLLIEFGMNGQLIVFCNFY